MWIICTIYTLHTSHIHTEMLNKADFFRINRIERNHRLTWWHKTIRWIRIKWMWKQHTWKRKIYFLTRANNNQSELYRFSSQHCRFCSLYVYINKNEMFTASAWYKHCSIVDEALETIWNSYDAHTSISFVYCIPHLVGRFW